MRYSSWISAALIIAVGCPFTFAQDFVPPPGFTRLDDIKPRNQGVLIGAPQPNSGSSPVRVNQHAPVVQHRTVPRPSKASVVYANGPVPQPMRQPPSSGKQTTHPVQHVSPPKEETLPHPQYFQNQRTPPGSIPLPNTLVTPLQQQEIPGETIVPTETFGGAVVSPRTALPPPGVEASCPPGCQLPPDEAARFFDVANAEAPPSGVAELASTLGGVAKNLTVLTASKDVKVILGGVVTGDFLYNSALPVGPGTPFFLAPDSLFGFSQDTFDAHARQTTLFAIIAGPEIWDFKTSAVVAANFYDVSVVQDQYGLLPLQAWADMKNDDWRFAAGLQFDIFNPLAPRILPFSLLVGSGNTGNAYRGQARVERYFYPGLDSQVTIQAGLSEPISTFFSQQFLLSEDNGWPNLEGRVAYAFGPRGSGLLKKRPFEIGFSAVVGQLRNTEVGAGVRVVDEVWGVGCDCRWEITQRWGIKGEWFAGKALGTYGGGILTTVNPNTLKGVRSVGGWLEVYYYICPEVLHTHVGYGVDDPLDQDLAPSQALRNQTIFGNIIWDVTSALQVGLELTYRETSYSPFLPDNQGVGLHGQVRYKF